MPTLSFGAVLAAPVVSFTERLESLLARAGLRWGEIEVRVDPWGPDDEYTIRAPAFQTTSASVFAHNPRQPQSNIERAFDALARAGLSPRKVGSVIVVMKPATLPPGLGSVLGSVKPIVDPESGKSLDDLIADLRAAEKVLYALPYGSREARYREAGVSDLRKRVQRLRLRIEKAKRGLRLSSHERYLVGWPAGVYVGGSAGQAAILRGNEIVGWMLIQEHRHQVMARDANYSIGTQVSTHHIPLRLDGRTLSGGRVGGYDSGWLRANEALDEFARYLQQQAG
jgi:hypothetical protein